MQQLVGGTTPSPGGPPPAYKPPALPKASKQATLPKPQKTTRHICAGHTSRVTAVAWAPKGTHIATSSYDKTVRVLDASNGSTILTHRGHWDIVEASAWSSDGKRIACGADQ